MLKQIWLSFVLAASLALAASTTAFAQNEATAAPGETAVANTNIATGYAEVNGLKMYYEIHGAGEPIVVLHGAYMSIDMMGGYVSRLAETRQVIAVELQGHGRTADVDRPLTYEGMADDVAAFMGAIGVEKADLFGYSLGAGVAVQVAIRHPEVVDKLVAASVSYNSDGMHPGLMEGFDQITPEIFKGSPWEAEYLRLAPHPEDFATLVNKLKVLDTTPQDWPAESIHGIIAPTFIILGDSDVVRPEHIVEMFRLLGGGVAGDMVGLPNARLAILPGTTHVGMIDRGAWLVPMINEFLDAPVK